MGDIFSKYMRRSPYPLHPTCVPKPTGTQHTMTAVFYASHGSDEHMQLSHWFQRPRPIRGQLLIRVNACSINPVDIKLRSNSIPGMIIPLPKIPGADFCGIVVDASQSETKSFHVGDRVFGMMPILFSAWGSFAEFAIDEDLLALAPENFSDEECASIPLVGLTVIQGLRDFIIRCSGDTRGKKILIQGASGGVGTFAVQYCKNALHMYVFATCGPGHVKLVQSLGADEVMDYTCEHFEDFLSQCDAVFDTKSYIYEERTLRFWVEKAASGRNNAPSHPHPPLYISIASSSNRLDPQFRDPLGLAIPEARLDKWVGKIIQDIMHSLPFRKHSYSRQEVFVEPCGEDLKYVSKLVTEKYIVPVIDSMFTLEDFKEAFSVVEDGHAAGKVVVTMQH